LRMFRILNFIDQLNPGNVFGSYGGEAPATKSFAGATRRIVDLPGKARVIKATTGVKLYPFDVSKGKLYATSKLNAQIKKLQYQLKKEKKQGDLKNASRLLKLIRELKEEKNRRF